MAMFAGYPPAARISPREDHMSIRLRLSGRDREGLVQAAKMAVAAVVAWLAARQLGGPQSFIAPYAAVLIMNGTVYRSLVDAARQVTTVVLGVLVAFVVAGAGARGGRGGPPGAPAGAA